MNKKIILSTIAATILLAGPAFVSSPYMALVFLDLDLYYDLKANRLAVDECMPFIETPSAMDICMDTESSRIARELKK